MKTILIAIIIILISELIAYLVSLISWIHYPYYKESGYHIILYFMLIYLIEEKRRDLK